MRSHDFPPPARLQEAPPQFSNLKVEGHRARPRRHQGKALDLQTEHGLSFWTGLFASDIYQETGSEVLQALLPCTERKRDIGDSQALSSQHNPITFPLLRSDFTYLYLWPGSCYYTNPAEVCFIVMEKSAADQYPLKGHPGTSHSTHGCVTKQQPSALLMCRHMSCKQFV